MLKNIWNYRLFILSSIVSEIKLRAARSRLAFFWAAFHPLFQASIYIVVLSGIMSSKMPNNPSRSQYAFYLLTGTLCWSLFSEIVSRTTSIFIEKADLIKKVAFPRITLPAIVCGGALINNFILALIVLFLYAIMGQSISWDIIFLPLLMALTTLLALGFGLILGILNVFIRDIGQMTIVALQVLFWSTPVVYLSEILPEKLRPFIEYNPLSHLVNCYRNPILNQTSPPLESLLIVVTTAAMTLFIAVRLYRKASGELADAL